MDIDKIYKEGLEAQHKINGTKEIIGQIQCIEEAPRGPVGHFYLDNDKYTCWNKEFLDGFKTGDHLDKRLLF